MHVNPFIQMRLISEVQNIWQADDLNTKRVFKVPTAIVGFLIGVETVGFEAAKSRLVHEGSVKESDLNALIFSLEKIEMLVTSERRRQLEQRYRQFFELEWNQGPAWIESLQYFMAGYDFPFADYSPEGDGRKQVSERMHRYASAERDTKRFNCFDQRRILSSDSLPSPISAVGVLSKSDQLNYLEKLKCVCSGVFGMTKTVKLAWDGERLFRRTSPSGGSRHPSEGYLLLNNPDTAYHIRTEGPQLDMIANDEQSLARILLGNNKSLYGAILFSSRFERNMFRYREPRTFRTVHMDVGHLMATATRYLKAAKFTDISVVNEFDHGEFSLLCGSDHFEEGLVAALVFKAPTEIDR